jgi:hypothetical protein
VMDGHGVSRDRTAGIDEERTSLLLDSPTATAVARDVLPSDLADVLRAASCGLQVLTLMRSPGDLYSFRTGQVSSAEPTSSCSVRPPTSLWVGNAHRARLGNVRLPTGCQCPHLARSTILFLTNALHPRFSAALISPSKIENSRPFQDRFL